MPLRSIVIYPALTVALTVMFLLSASVLPAQAFALENVYWQSNNEDLPCANQSLPLNYQPCTIEVSTSGLTIADWQNTANQAMAQWLLHDSTDGHLIFQYQANTGLVMGVTMTQGDLGGYNGNYITLATTSYQYSGSAMAFVTITVSTDTAISWCTFSMQTSTGCTNTESTLDHAMTHELGHGLGLAHPVTGPNGNAVMECIQAMGEISLVQVDDVLGERYYYGGGPSGTPVKPPC